MTRPTYPQTTMHPDTAYLLQREREELLAFFPPEQGWDIGDSSDEPVDYRTPAELAAAREDAAGEAFDLEFFGP